MAEENLGPRSGGRPLPHCKAMLLCEEIVVDPVSGLISLLSLSPTLHVAEFPGESQPFAVYLQLYDGIGRYALTMQISDLSDDITVGNAQVVELDFPERLATIEVVVPVESVYLHQPSRYELVILADGRELARRYFKAEVEDVGEY